MPANKIRITVELYSGEVDPVFEIGRISRTVRDEQAAVSVAIHEMLEDWVLSPGDTIRVLEKPVRRVKK